jgi:hypothetical protein
VTSETLEFTPEALAEPTVGGRVGARGEVKGESATPSEASSGADGGR